MPPSKPKPPSSKNKPSRPKVGRPADKEPKPTRHVAYFYPEHEKALAQIMKFTKKRVVSAAICDAITFQHAALRKESPDDFK